MTIDHYDYEAIAALRFNSLDYDSVLRAKVRADALNNNDNAANRWVMVMLALRKAAG